MGAIAEGFVAYAQPLIDQTDGSHEQLNKAMVIAQLCFNLAITPEDQRDTMLGELQPSLKMDDKEFEEFQRSIVEPMIQRHQEMFPRMHRQPSPGSWLRDLSTSSNPGVTTTAKGNTSIDRYSPCPCNSGEKYKFCCGKKGR